MRSAFLGLVTLGIAGFAVYWFDPLGIFAIKPIAEIVPADVESIRNSAPIKVAESDWPWWRGANRDAVATGPMPPSEFSDTKNVLWSAEVPGRGHSSPILIGDKIFLTTADEKAKIMSLLCLSRKDGKKQWKINLHEGGFPVMHERNSQASATPASDGKLVFTAFVANDKLLVSAVDLDGKIVWQKEAGPFQSKFGYAASPALYRSLVIVAGDHVGSSYVAALDRETGELKWRKARGVGASFSAPIIGEVSGKTQLLLSGQNTTSGYDPASGELLWSCAGPADTTASSMAFAGDRVFATGGFPQAAIMCIKGDGSGARLWKKTQKMYVPSLLVKDGLVFGVRDDGIAVCLDIEKGEKIWQERLPQSEFSASPTAVGDLLYVPNMDGKVFVLRAGKKYEVVAANEMKERIMASPVISGGKLYLRTTKHLYCIGAGAEPPTSE